MMRKLAYVKLNNQTPKAFGAVPVNQGCRSEVLSLHNVRIAFGNGCDHSSYVSFEHRRIGIVLSNLAGPGEFRRRAKRAIKGSVPGFIVF